MASEEIIEVDDLLTKKANTGESSASSTTNATASSTTTSISAHKFLKPQISIGSLSSNKNSLKNLVKIRTAVKTETNNITSSSETATTSKKPDDKPQTVSVNNKPTTDALKPSALSLLSGYDDDDDSNSDESN